jgi:NAD+ synthase (glutamine-hydrolysing)
VKLAGAPLLYVNQSGATDEILFDGRSFAMNAQGEVVGQLPAFEPGIAVVDFDGGKLQWREPLAGAGAGAGAKPGHSGEAADLDVLAAGLVTGIREYFGRTGFKTALLGLSGGIDSALVATLAAHALGPKHVLGVAMPSQYSSGHSLEDAETLAQRLGVHFEVRPIKFLFSAASRDYSERRGELAPIALENLQSRLRGMTLMTLANHYGALVLTTGNKSELATGYGTLYGDMVGALNPIGDLYKTEVYKLARHLNGPSGEGSPIPERTFTKAPSAELKPGQTDQDTLPPYDRLDAFLEDFIEKNLPRAELARLHPDLPLADLLRRIEINEFKRRQAPPILKVSTRSFGIGRRVPLARAWDV